MFCPSLSGMLIQGLRDCWTFPFWSSQGHLFRIPARIHEHTTNQYYGCWCASGQRRKWGKLCKGELSSCPPVCGLLPVAFVLSVVACRWLFLACGLLPVAFRVVCRCVSLVVPGLWLVASPLFVCRTRQLTESNGSTREPSVMVPPRSAKKQHALNPTRS